MVGVGLVGCFSANISFSSNFIELQAFSFLLKDHKWPLYHVWTKSNNNWPCWPVMKCFAVSWLGGWIGLHGWYRLKKSASMKSMQRNQFYLSNYFQVIPLWKWWQQWRRHLSPLNHRLLTIEYSVAEYSLFINELYVDNECHVLLMLPGAFWRIDDPNCLIATSTKARHSCIVYKYLLLSAWEWWVRLIQMTVESLI